MKLEIIAQESTTLKKELLKYKDKLSFTKINSALRKKDVKVNGRKTNDENLKLYIGDKIEVFYQESEIKIEKIYEDENIVVAFKPFGIETTKMDKTHYGKSLEELVGFTAIHRLDMFTEGLVICAKNKESESELLNAIKYHQIEKTYTALINGSFKTKSGVLTDYHAFDSKEKIAHISKTNKKGYTQIITKFKLIKSFENNTSLVEIGLVTGKTHQIRAHLEFHNHAIVGDSKYGDTKVNKAHKFKHQCLSASQIKFNFSKDCFLYYLNDKKIYATPTWLKKIISF